MNCDRQTRNRSARKERIKMTLGVIGKKLGMTQIFDEQGLAVPVTIIKVDPIVVTQVKTVETDGYNAIQVGTVAAKEKHLTKAQIGHFKKNNLENFRYLQEFRVDNPADYTVGQAIELSILDNVAKVDVTGKSIGKGFQGTVKRWNFSRGPMAHGSKNHREPGSIGAGTTPSRVIKGKRMAGNMGNERVTVTKLKLVKVDTEKNLVLVKGSVPGCEGRLVTIVPTRTKWNKVK
jgi:large subunit ribosomal protein L3